MSDSHTSPSDASHGSVKSYVVGLILSIVLTVIAFAAVMSGALDATTAVIVIVAAAVLQILVQLVMFMHLNFKTDEGWQFISIVFSILIIAILVGGSIWIMVNLHFHTMPG